MCARRVQVRPLGATPIALVAGVLDTGGNVLYMLARQYVRLDVAAVLSSLYPVSTVLLSWLISRERVSPTQWLGVVVCIASIALITV
jgi:drug/metabolite transporter (DMT)-like permease